MAFFQNSRQPDILNKAWSIPQIWLFLAVNYFYNKLRLTFLTWFWRCPSRSQTKNYYGGIDFLNDSKTGIYFKLWDFFGTFAFKSINCAAVSSLLSNEFLNSYRHLGSTEKRCSYINCFKVVCRFGNSTYIVVTFFAKISYLFFFSGFSRIFVEE